MGFLAYYARWLPCFSDKIARVKVVTNLHLDVKSLEDFNLKEGFEDASSQAIDESLPFVVECDASEVAISVTLKPTAFASRSLSKCEFNCPPVEKEATAVVEGKRHHFLASRHFILVME